MEDACPIVLLLLVLSSMTWADDAQEQKKTGNQLSQVAELYCGHRPPIVYVKST